MQYGWRVTGDFVLLTTMSTRHAAYLVVSEELKAVPCAMNELEIEVLSEEVPTGYQESMRLSIAMAKEESRLLRDSMGDKWHGLKKEFFVR